MEVIKKITIVAVLIASVMLIINLFDDTSEEVKEYAITGLIFIYKLEQQPFRQIDLACYILINKITIFIFKSINVSLFIIFFAK